MSLCDHCNGACCRWIITGTREANADNAALLQMRGGRFAKGVVFLPLACEKLDVETGKCTDYEGRLGFCKSFKPGSLDCLACRRLEREAGRLNDGVEGK